MDFDVRLIQMKKRVLILILCLLMLLSYSNNTSSLVSSNVRVDHLIFVERFSGVVSFSTTINITNPSDKDTLTYPDFTIKYPKNILPTDY